jgi:hypothetical protein
MTGTVHWRHALLHAVMKIEVAVAELKGVRVAIAFAPPSWVAPGVGDALLARLRPYFPTLPILLAAPQGRRMRAYAPFQAQALVDGADLDKLARHVIDLDAAPPPPDHPLPF